MQGGSLDRVDRLLAVDAVGYSRLMEADERGTRERLKMLHHELVDSRIAEHRGRIVKNHRRWAALGSTWEITR